MAPEQVQYYFQLSQLQSNAAAAAAAASNSTAAAAGSPQIAQLPPGAQVIQQQNGQIIIATPQSVVNNLTAAPTNVSSLLIHVQNVKSNGFDSTNRFLLEHQNFG